jgi:hypothetical protein
MIAELTAVGISLASLHIPFTGQNQFNPGIHAEVNDVVRTGVFVNSRDRVSAYVGGQLYLTRTEIAGIPTSIRVFGALATGYKSPVIGGLELVAGSVVLLIAPKTNDSAWTLGFALRKEL